MTEPQTTEAPCACTGGSTYGTPDPSVRRCDLCGGIVPTDPATGEYATVQTTARPTADDLTLAGCVKGDPVHGEILASDGTDQCSTCWRTMPAGEPSWWRGPQDEADPICAPCVIKMADDAGAQTATTKRTRLADNTRSHPTSDLVERLRAPPSSQSWAWLMEQSANEIERLRAVIRVNALRWSPDLTHEEIERVIQGL